MSFVRAVAVNTVVQLGGRVVTTVLSLVLIAALTRYLGVAAFGEYTTIFAYVAFFGVFADFGFFWILVREIATARDRNTFDSIVSNVLTLRTLVGIGVFALGAALAWLIPQYSGDIWVGIAIISLAWLATALNSTFVGVFQNKLRMDQAVLTDVVGRAIILGTVLWLITSGASLTTLLVAYVLGNWANLLVSFALGRQYVTVRPSFDTALWRRIFWEAFPMGVVLVLHVIYFRIDSVMLSLMRGVTDVGIYGAPYKVLEVLLTLPLMFLGNVFPTLTRLLTDGPARAGGLIQRSFDALLTIALPLTVGGILVAEPIIRLVAGEAFVTAATIGPVAGLPATAVTTLQILMVALGIAFFSHLFNYVMIALGRQRELVRPYLVFMVVNVIANLLVIPSLSYIGASLATVLTELVVMLYLGALALKATNVRLDWSMSGRIGLATVVMTLFLVSVDAPLEFTVPSAVVVYGLACWGTGVITPAFMRELVQSKRSV